MLFQRFIYFLVVSLYFSISSIVIAEKVAPLVFGVPPIYNHVTLEKGFTPVIEYLQEVLEQPVQLKVFESYGTLLDEVKNNQVDIAIMGPALYVHAKNIYPKLKYLATTQTTKYGKKRGFYFGHIIVHIDSGMKTLEDLKGRSFNYVSEHSTSGYRFPRYFFKEREIDPDKFFKAVNFAGSHEKITDMIAGRMLDVGVNYDVNLWDAENKYGKIFHTIAKIGPIVNPALVVNHSMQGDLLIRIKDSFTNIPDEILNSHFPFTGFIELSDSNYDHIRRVIDYSSSEKKTKSVLDVAMESNDLNDIFDAYAQAGYDSEQVSQHLNNNIFNNIFVIQGKVTGAVPNLIYSNGWYNIENAAVLEFDQISKAYLDSSEILKTNSMLKLKVKVIGLNKNNDMILKVLNYSK